MLGQGRHHATGQAWQRLLDFTGWTVDFSVAFCQYYSPLSSSLYTYSPLFSLPLVTPFAGCPDCELEVQSRARGRCRYVMPRSQGTVWDDFPVGRAVGYSRIVEFVGLMTG